MAEIRINATGELKLYDSDDSNYVSFKSAGTVSSNIAWTLPSADGSSGQMLSTNGSGTLSWATASSADPSSADGDSLGTASAEWSDLFLADGGIIKFGNDQDTLLTHTDGTGLTLNSTNKLCFNDASQFIQGSSATVLSIGATDEIDLTATAVDLNGTFDVSGTSQFNAAVTLAGTTPTLTIGDAGAEDTKIVFDGNAQDWHIGLDDSTDDFVIGLGSTLGTTSHIVIDEAGTVTKPLQPAFNVNSATMSNLAINTSHDVQYNSERFDVNADFDTGTYTFTAPVTGKYMFCVMCGLESLDMDTSYYRLTLATSNEDYNPFLFDPAVFDEDAGWYAMTFTAICDMDASDTAKVVMTVTNDGAAQADISNRSVFSGYLAC